MANVRKWSVSASGNASVAGGVNTINWAEGQLPATVNNSAREMMAQMRSIYTPEEWGWVESSATASVASQTVIKLPGDLTSAWAAGRRWRLKSGSTTRYGSVVSSSYTVETTITVAVDSGSLSASHSLVALASTDINAVPYATAANFRANASNRVLVTDRVWSSADTVALSWTSGGTTAVDLSAGFNFTVTTATGNSTLGAPTNAKTGQSGFIYITQDATTPRTLAYDAAWVFAGGTDPALTATAGAKDILFYQVISSTGPVVFGSLIKGVS